MLYNLLKNKNYIQTAGKITVATAISGILIFAFIFLFNAGKTELMRVEAQTATTTLQVLNTPPDWTASTTELVESSVSNPTNSGSVVTWTAIGTDPNGTDYHLLICSTAAAPSSTNGGAPRCNGGIQWGVSTATVSGQRAYVSTTTVEGSTFLSGANVWYGWICDIANPDARCNSASTQGLNATNSSPFVVNYRPTFTAFSNTSPADPGSAVTFHSTSSDPDGNNITLVVCSTATFSTTTNNCGANTIATTSGAMTNNAFAIYNLPQVIRDQNYNAFGYLIDEFNHTAIGATQGSNSQITVNNVAPTVASSSISINGGAPIVIVTPAGETNGITLSFTTSDANSCRTFDDNFEMTNFVASLYRAPTLNATTCSGSNAGHYDPNNCYTSAVATTTWNISCTASTTSCASAASSTDPTMDWNCTFPVWYVTDPTDAGPFVADNWRAAIAGVDNNNATGTQTESASGVNVNSNNAMRIPLNTQIPYGSLEPGQNSGTLSASTTIEAVGNTGLDQNFYAESMCDSFTVMTECVSSATSTIPEDQQRVGTSTVAYSSGFQLSSTTPLLVDINIPKSTSTTTPASLPAYWGIAVPMSITKAGAYTGLNTFQAVTSY